MYEIGIAINTLRIVFIVVPTLAAKRYPDFLTFSDEKAKIHIWNKLILYREARFKRKFSAMI